MPEHHPVHDPTVLRAIAHPVRNRILAELEATGSMRAADIARELAIPANQASFHLRQLAKYGLVVEAPDEARDRRDRVWRAVGPLSLDLGEIEQAPGGRAAAAVFRRSKADWARVVIDAALRGRRDPKAHRSLTEYALRLNRDEAQQLNRELGAVLEAWNERTRDRPAADATTYVYLAALLPHPEEDR